MKKTVTINLNSFIFNIDEDAYKVLHVYLEKLSEHFGNNEEGREIIKDIEARIAELFSEKLSENKQVINIDDVNEVISILGYVNDIIDSDETEDTSKKEEKKKRDKKFFRDPDNKMLAGVCSGLAAYTGVSIIVWRIIFLVFLFIPGNISIVAYIILWIAVPMAKTTAQKLEMKGEKVNLENIEKTVKEEYEDLKENLKNWDSKRFSDIVEKIWNAIVSVFRIIVKVMSPIIGGGFILVGMILSILLIIGFVSVSSENIFYSDGWINFIWLPSVLELVTNSEIAWLLSIAIFILFIIPLIALIYGGILLLFKLKGNKFLSGSLLVLWILSIVMTVFLTINVARGYESVAYSSYVSEIPLDTTSNYTFSLLDNDPTFDKNYILSYDRHGRKKVEINSLNELHLLLRSNFIQLHEDKIKVKPSLRFRGENIQSPEIEYRYYARGRTRSEAQDNIDLISYEYNISDSIVEFAPFYDINSRRWKAQELRITVLLPYESRITIHNSLANLIDGKDVTGNHKNGELAGNKWIVTKEGLVKL